MILLIQKKTLLICLLTIGLISISSYFSYGQGKNEEVTIIAPYIPTISNAAKIPFRPEITPTDQDTPSFEYKYVTKRLETRMELDPVEPMKYSEEEQGQVYRNYAKVGIGNYYTPYLDFMASSLKSEKYQLGARIMHLSSEGNIKNYPPSAYSHNLVSVFGRTFTKTHTLSADIGYKRDVVHFYGFSPDSIPDVEYTKDDLKQRYQDIHGSIEYGSNYKQDDKLNHLLRFGFHYFTDKYETRESQVSFFTGLDKSLSSIGKDYKHSLALDLGLEYLAYKDSLTASHQTYFMIRPAYRFGFGPYSFEAGLDINMASEDTPSGSNFGIDVFPILKAEVVIVDEKLKAFAEVTGNRTINSFRSLADRNPFITSTPVMKYTDEQIKIGGGITGNSGGLNFLAEASYSYLNDMPLFVTDTLLALQNKFDVIYDNINLLKIKASLGYVRINQLSARLLAAYYHYIPKDENKAWQMPNFEIGLDAGYTLLEKYTFRTSMLALGSKYARTFDNSQVVPVKINGAFDLSLGFDYQVNHLLSAFIDANNILNQNYQRWYQYPVQGILVMAGVKLTF
jgi:hypothetical protein